MSESLSSQVGGRHYKDLAIQPTEFCQRNGLGWCESNVVKYVSRHRAKNGRQDIEKAIHYLQILLELEYPQPKPATDFPADLPPPPALPEGYHRWVYRGRGFKTSEPVMCAVSWVDMRVWEVWTRPFAALGNINVQYLEAVKDSC